MAIKNKTLQGAVNLGRNAALAYGDYQLSALGMTDVVRDDMYKGSTAEGFAKAGNIGGSVSKAIMPVALSAIGVPPSATIAGQQALSGTANKALLDKQAEKEANKAAREAAMIKPLGTTLPQSNLGSYQAYEKGGQPKGVIVNIEKDELEVNPETGEIVSDFKGKPEHPKGKDIVNLKGNVAVNTKNVIIPAKYRKDYMEGSKEVRLEIIHEVLEAQEEREGENGKMEGGGLAPIALEETTLNTAPAIARANQAYSNQATPSADGGGSMSGVDSGTVGALATGAVNLGFSANQARESKKALEKLQKTPKPKYEITPEQKAAYLKAQGQEQAALGRARTGYTAEERAAFEQNMGRQAATQEGMLRRAGQGSQQLSAATKAAGVNALLQFAASDAQKRQQNIQYADQAGRYTNQVGGQISAQRNQMVGSELQQRLQQEQALGQALQQGRVGSANALGNIAGYGAMGFAQSQGASAPAPSGVSNEQLLALLNK
jgi:hypothetical protein